MKLTEKETTKTIQKHLKFGFFFLLSIILLALYPNQKTNWMGKRFGHDELAISIKHMYAE